jgi:hypothetical protein
MLPNLAITQLSKVLKWQIENNDAFSIQLKLRIQANVDAKITFENTLINDEHVHVQVCKFKTFRICYPNLITTKMIKKVHKKYGTKGAKIKCGAITQKVACKYIK